MSPERLIEDEHFFSTRDWAMVMATPVIFEIEDLGAVFEFWAGARLLAYHEHGKLVVSEAYALDGYSPVIRVFGKWVKLTPVPKKAGHGPDLLHDLTRQFLHVPFCPWTRKQTDDWFFDELIAGGESAKIAGAYHQVVAGSIGSLWMALKREPDPSLKIMTYPYR